MLHDKYLSIAQNDNELDIRKLAKSIRGNGV